MRKNWLFSLALLAALLMAVPAVAQMSINGAGATFPQPVYGKWAYTYNEAKGVKVNYQGIGSGGGIAQIKAKTVDFGGTDDPLKPNELQGEGLYQFPTLMGGVVPVFNRQGHGCRPACPGRPHPGQDFHGRDHQVERPGHQKAQSPR